MKLRLLLGIVITTILPTATPAQSPFADRPTGVTPEQRATLLQGMERGAAFVSNNHSYRLLPAARAIRLTAGETTRQALGRLQIAHSEALEHRGNMLLYRDLAAAAAGAVLRARDHATAYPVVLNTDTQELGFLPGTIRAALARTGDAPAVAAAHGATVYRSFPQLGVVYFRVAPGQDVLSLATVLAADAGVTRAEPEVVEHLRVPR